MSNCSIPDNQRPITIMTANFGYASNDHDKKKRLDAITILLDNKEPTIVMVQESLFKDHFDESGSNRNFTPNHEIVTIKDVTFIYDSTHIKLTSEDIVKEVKPYDLPPDKISMVEAEPTDKSKPKFLCVSWHGVHKAKDNVKRKDLTSLIKFVTMFSGKKKLPVIIGGDFNAPFSGIESVIDDTRSSLCVYNYRPSRRRCFKTTIDFFVSSRSLTLTCIAPVDWGHDDVNDLLDHDPIIADLQFNPYKDEQDDTSSVKEEPKRTNSVIDDSFKDLTIKEKVIKETD